MRVTDHLAVVAGLQYGLAGPFDCNVYALRAPEGVVLIDSGGGVDNQRLLARLEWSFPGVRLAAILLTHAHPDHAAGAGFIRAQTGARVFAPAATASSIEQGDEEGMGLKGGKEAGIYPADFQLVPCPIDTRVNDGDVLDVAGIRVEARLIRGHSPDSTAYLLTMADQRHLFSGDILFYGGVLGLINAAGSDLGAYRQDLPNLEHRNIDVFCPGHGMFAIRGGQKHVDLALEGLRENFVPRMIGQWDRIL